MNNTIKTAALVASAALAPLAANAQETISLTFASAFPPVLLPEKMILEDLIPEVNAELERNGSDYRIDWTLAPGGTLIKGNEAIDALNSGLADMASVSHAQESAKLGLLGVGYFTPFSTDNIGTVIQAFAYLNEEFPSSSKLLDDNGLHFVGAFSAGNFVIMSKQPIATVADFDGVRMGTGGPNFAWFKNTGATGVQASPANVFTMLQSGAIDAVADIRLIALGAKTYEEAPNMLEARIGAAPSALIAFSKDRFESLPEDVQAAIDHAGEYYMQKYAETAMQLDAEATDKLKELGVNVTEMSDEAKAEWVNGMDPIAKSWAADMDAKGLDGTGVLNAYMTFLRDNGATPVRAWDEE